MRRVSLVLSVVVLFGSLAVWSFNTHAQEPFATPGPGEFELVPGQIGCGLVGGLAPEPPAGPVRLALLRFTNEPGSVYTGTEDDPSVGLILVESGEMTVRIDGPVTITRASGPEEVAAGTEFTLGPGESFLWPPNVAGEVRNDGQEPAVTLVTYLAPAEEEAATPMAGTPTP
jgi:Cupin domain